MPYNCNALSQVATPPIASPPPSTPFESINADYIGYEGRHFSLATVPIVKKTFSRLLMVLHLLILFDLFGNCGLISKFFHVGAQFSSDRGREFFRSNKSFPKRMGRAPPLFVRIRFSIQR